MPLSSSLDLSSSYYYPGVNMANAMNNRPATAVFSSATFSSNALATIFGPQSVGQFSLLTLTMLNNSVNNLISGTVDFSPDGISGWLVSDATTFLNLTSSGAAAASFTGNSKGYLRVRAWPSGSGGQNTGSLGIWLNMSRT